MKTECISDAHTKELEKAGCIMLILPSHTAAALQPLDRDILGPFKTFLERDDNVWFNNHQNIQVTRMQLGMLTGGAWKRATSVAKCHELFKPQDISFRSACNLRLVISSQFFYAAETEGETEPDFSESLNNKSPEHSSSAVSIDTTII
jgi:hypothetical protein